MFSVWGLHKESARVLCANVFPFSVHEQTIVWEPMRCCLTSTDAVNEFYLRRP